MSVRAACAASSPSSETLVLLQDWQPTQTFVDEIRTQVIWLGSVTFLFALVVGGVVLSRRVTRPLREIATAAQEVAAGQWDRRVPTRGHDEATMSSPWRPVVPHAFIYS